MYSINAAAARGFRLAVRGAALLVIAIGCSGFLGWVLGNETLKSPLQDGITIKANGALGLILTGIALWLLRIPRPVGRLGIFARGCASLTAVLGAATLFEHFSERDLGIDQFLFHEPSGALATASPGRMGLPASASLLFAGIALCFLDSRFKSRRLAAQFLAIVVCGIPLVSLIGYAYGATPLYGVPGYTGIAFHTAVALLTLGFGLLCCRPAEGLMAIVSSDDVGGVMARRLVLAAFLLPIAGWWLRILAEKIGWVHAELPRPLAALLLSACGVVAILWIARRMSALEHERERGFARTVEILESVSDAFYAIDPDARFTYVNRQAEELWGRPRGSLLGKSLWTELPDTAGDTQAAAHREVLHTREPHRYETFSARLQRWFDVSLYPESGGGVSGFFRDVTERREVEAELRRARDAAEKANQAKSEFLATLSHEIRTPLNPVLLTLDYLEAHPEFPASLHGEVSSIRRHVDLEIQLISDLLDITRIESGKLQLHLSEVDLHEMVRAVVVMCQRADGAAIRLELQRERCFVRGDAVRLHQVVWNLLNNALKFTDAGGLVTIRTRTSRPGTVQIEVIDTGAGISSELMPRLFNAFEQGETRTARQRSGLGLGLTIARKIAEAHQGTISATSEGVGLGARFVVELPLLAAPPAPLSPPVRAVVTAGTGPLHILLVEDHLPTLQAMTRLLQMMGHRVATAATSADAEKTAVAGSFHLLISDLGLPDENGLEMMKRLRPQFVGRAIAITGYGAEADIRAAHEAGFTEHLTKPVQLSQLKAAIARVVASATTIAR